MRVGVFWSGLMHSQVGWGVPGDIISELAKEMGLKSVQFNLTAWIKGTWQWSYHVGGGLLDSITSESHYELQSFFDRNNLEPDPRISPVAHPSKQIGDFFFRRNVEELKISRSLGAKTVIAHGFDFYWRFRMEKEAAIRLVERQLAKVAEAADGFGLRLALEMDTIYYCKFLNSTEIRDVVENARKKTGLDNIGIHIDPVNATFTPGDSAIERTKIFAPYVFAGHAKDASLEDGIWKDCIVGEGSMPWPEIVGILKDANCDAAFALEHHEANILKAHDFLSCKLVKKATIESLRYLRSLGLR